MDITFYKSNSTLDLVLSNDPYNVCDLHVKPGISDHERVVFTVSTSMKNLQQTKHKAYDYNNADMDLLYNSFAYVSWPNIKHATCINTAWEEWKRVFFSIVDNVVPSRCVSSSKPNLPWINSYHKCMIRKQNRLHRQIKQNNSKMVRTKYANYRKIVKSELKKAERDYISAMCDNVDKNPRQFWNYLKVKRSNDIGIGSSRNGEQICNNNLDKAGLLSDQFKSVFNNDQSVNNNLTRILDLHCVILLYLKRKFLII
jgi:hypothetical protein